MIFGFLKMYYVVDKNHSYFQTSKSSYEGFREWCLKIGPEWKFQSNYCFCLLMLFLLIVLTPAHIYQQNSQNLFSYFTTLRISMTDPHVKTNNHWKMLLFLQIWFTLCNTYIGILKQFKKNSGYKLLCVRCEFGKITYNHRGFFSYYYNSCEILTGQKKM